MSIKNAKRWAELVMEIANGGKTGTRYPVMSGTVKAVDNDKLTCTVALSVNDPDTETAGVMLNGVSLSSKGLILYPKVDSTVWVAEVDGPGKHGLIKCSELEKCVVTIGNTTVEVKDGSVKLNGDGKGGLVQIQELKDNLDTLKDYIKNTLEPAIGIGFTAVGASTAANGANGKTAFDLQTSPKVITLKDMENTKVKHG